MRWAVLAVLLWVVLTASPVSSLAPVGVPGYPPCLGGEMGYWQPYIVDASTDGTLIVRLVLTAQNFLDPAYIVCWVQGDQQVRVTPSTAPTAFAKRGRPQSWPKGVGGEHGG